MSERPSLDNYIDVAERIAAFAAKYPEGTLETIDWSAQEIFGAQMIVYRAAAYRTPDDPRPGHGIAWEPFPGTTPYTRNSELMNAETAAWGRAIVACGLPASRHIASLQEVRARAEEREAGGNGNGAPTSQQPSSGPARPSGRPASANQRSMLKARAGDAGLSAVQLADIVLGAAGELPRSWSDEDAASRWLARAMDRLPAKHVDAVLEGIAKAHA